MRSHRRRTPVDHVVVAGDVADLPSIVRVLALLSADTYGQVFIEAPVGYELPALPRPPRVTICRLSPSPDALTAAIASWTAEWMPEEPAADRTVSVWIGAHASTRIDAEWHTFGDLVERI